MITALLLASEHQLIWNDYVTGFYFINSLNHKSKMVIAAIRDTAGVSQV